VELRDRGRDRFGGRRRRAVAAMLLALGTLAVVVAQA
jgi:hypothetical protein